MLQNSIKILTNHFLQDRYKRLTLRGRPLKPLSALIAMQEGIITPETTYDCPGYYWAGNHKVPCFHGERHGIVNLASAGGGIVQWLFFDGV